MPAWRQNVRENTPIVKGAYSLREKDPDFIARLTHLVGQVAKGNLAEMERRAGLKKQTLKTYLKGGEPTRPVLIKLARAGNVSLDWLGAGEEKESAASPGIDKHQLAISIKAVLGVLAKESGGTDAGTAADLVVWYYLEWEHGGRQPSQKRLLSIVPRRR